MMRSSAACGSGTDGRVGLHSCADAEVGSRTLWWRLGLSEVIGKGVRWETPSPRYTFSGLKSNGLETHTAGFNVHALTS